MTVAAPIKDQSTASVDEVTVSQGPSIIELAGCDALPDLFNTDECLRQHTVFYAQPQLLWGLIGLSEHLKLSLNINDAHQAMTLLGEIINSGTINSSIAVLLAQCVMTDERKLKKIINHLVDMGLITKTINNGRSNTLAAGPNLNQEHLTFLRLHGALRMLHQSAAHSERNHKGDGKYKVITNGCMVTKPELQCWPLPANTVFPPRPSRPLHPCRKSLSNGLANQRSTGPAGRKLGS